MTYLQKQKEMLERLDAQNWAMFDGNKDEGLDFMGSAMSSFPNYVNSVVSIEISGPIQRMRLEPEDYRNAMQQMDRNRRICHNRAIDSVNQLNRMAKALGMEPFAEVDTTDRNAVADFAGRFVNEVYNHGIGGDMQSAVMNKNAPYRTENLAERLKKLDAIELEQTGRETDVGFHF